MDAKSALMIGMCVVLLASFVCTYMSSRTWRITHVLLVFLIFLASAAFWYLAAATLLAHKSYRAEANKLQAEVDQLKRANEALEYGTDDEQLVQQLVAQDIRLGDGIRKATHQLQQAVRHRGRIWQECQPEGVAADGGVTLKIGNPAPHGLEAGSVVFAFEAGDPAEGTQFIGELRVAGVQEEGVTLQPTMKPTPAEMQRVKNSATAWVLYETMPRDHHSVFAHFTEEELTAQLARLSEQTRREFLKDGKPASPDDPREQVAGYKKDGVLAGPDEQDEVVEERYVRKLIAYGPLFRDIHRQYYLAKDAAARLGLDNARLENAVNMAQQDIGYRKKEAEQLGGDLKIATHERNAARQQLSAVDGWLTQVRNEVRRLFVENERLAAELASVQDRLKKQIDLRSDGADEPRVSLREPARP